MRVALPGLETVEWFDGRKTEGEPITEEVVGDKFGGGARGLVSWMKEWTTAHPRIDSITNELILFHSTFVAPFVHYSIIPSTYNNSGYTTSSTRKCYLLPCEFDAYALLVRDLYLFR